MRTAIKVEYINHMGSDDSVVDAARVSYSKTAKSFTAEQNTKLIRYLARHGHKSPFHHTFATFRVKAPMVVARQLQKHKFMPWNEISRRYVDDDPEYYEPKHWRGRPKNSKQGSSGIVNVASHLVVGYAQHQADKAYKELIKLGVAPEQARLVLPQSMMTEWIWSGTLSAFSDMCNLRCNPDTQYETQKVAYEIDDTLSRFFPISWEALRNEV